MAHNKLPRNKSVEDRKQTWTQISAKTITIAMGTTCWEIVWKLHLNMCNSLQKVEFGVGARVPRPADNKSMARQFWEQPRIVWIAESQAPRINDCENLDILKRLTAVFELEHFGFTSEELSVRLLSFKALNIILHKYSVKRLSIFQSFKF